jgi:hypothetical protein
MFYPRVCHVTSCHARGARRERIVKVGYVARHTNIPRSGLEAFLTGYLGEPFIGDCGAAWLEGWDDADLRIELGLPNRYAPPPMMAPIDRPPSQ